MELLTLCSVIYKAWGNISAIKDFVYDDLVEVLEAFGDIEYNAAIRALRDAKKSNDPKSHIISAVGNLRTAYEAFRHNAENISVFRSLSKKEMILWKKAFTTALLLSTIFKQLEDRDLELEYIEQARDSLDSYASLVAYLSDTSSFSFFWSGDKLERNAIRETRTFKKIYKQSAGKELKFTKWQFIDSHHHYLDEKLE